MPAKKVNKPEYAQLSLKIDKSLNDEVEVFWRRNLYQDKSSLVREALDYYIHAAKCDRCGAVNHPLAKRCAVCNEKMQEYKANFDEVKNGFEQVLQIIDGMHHAYSQCSEILKKFREISRGSDSPILSEDMHRYLESQLTKYDELLFFLNRDNICTEDMDVLDAVVSDWEDNFGYDLKDSYDIRESTEYEILSNLHETYLHLAGVYVDISLPTLKSLADSLKMSQNILKLHLENITAMYQYFSIMQKRLIKDS